MSQRYVPYNKNRLIKQHDFGFFVIKPESAAKRIPFYCEVCKFLLRTRDDELSYQDLSCCSWCAMTFANTNRAAWFDGWRPSEQEVNDALKLRPSLSIKIEFES